VALPHRSQRGLGLGLFGMMMLASLGLGCFTGYDLEDKQAPPGYAGGICLPQGCYDAVECLTEHDVCFDPAEPCRGIYCGGHGTCTIDMNNDDQPLCVCDPGYTNEVYAFFCT
jgi:hypothetical protein